MNPNFSFTEAKEVRKAILGFPTQDDFNDNQILLIGYLPDFLKNGEWVLYLKFDTI